MGQAATLLPWAHVDVERVEVEVAVVGGVNGEVVGARVEETRQLQELESLCGLLAFSLFD